MDRRAMLGLCGAAVTALAGCSGSSDDAETGTTRGPATTTGAPTEAALAIRSAETPDSVQLGRTYAVRFGIENRTGGTRTLRTPVSVRAGGEWQSFASVEAQVPPGTTAVEREFAAPRFLGTYRFRTEAPAVEWRVETTERLLGFGEPFTTPQGLSLVVLGGGFADSYGGAGNRTVTPPPDRQFLLVRVRVENPTDGAVTLPPLGTFRVRVGDETVEVALDDPGQRLTVNPGDRTAVELPFLVPAAVSAGDVAVRWTPRFRAGRTVAVWRQS